VAKAAKRNHSGDRRVHDPRYFKGTSLYQPFLENPMRFVPTEMAPIPFHNRAFSELQAFACGALQ